MTAKSIVSLVKFGFFVVLPVAFAMQAGLLTNVVSVMFSFLRSL